uniref:Uncharacterized protein n=1 Tax=Parascaris univalens TaxID=6257 RepID=A0A914ZK84_PARUN
HTNLRMAHTSPPRLRRHAVDDRYSNGFRRYVSIMKLRYATYTSGVLLLLRPLKNSGNPLFSI